MKFALCYMKFHNEMCLEVGFVAGVVSSRVKEARL